MREQNLFGMPMLVCPILTGFPNTMKKNVPKKNLVRMTCLSRSALNRTRYCKTKHQQTIPSGEMAPEDNP
jgi:hypothetical protein